MSRDFVSSFQRPLLVSPDDVPAHPHEAAKGVANLAPNAEVTIFPWNDSQAHVDKFIPIFPRCSPVPS